MTNKLESLTNEPPAEADVIDEEEFEEQLLEHAVLRLNSSVLGIVLGVVFGLTVFAATNWLILKGGDQVGTHLSLLNQFFIGYSVTFVGSLIGLLYGFLSGYIIGFVIAWIYNRIVILKGHKR